MKISKGIRGFSQSVVAIAVATAYGTVGAQGDKDIAQLTAAPGTAVSIGVGVVSGDEKDRARFGLFNGLRRDDFNGLLGFSYQNLEDTSGRWTTIEGRNLGLDSRELSLSHRWLGDLKFTAEYGELVRHDPRTINSSLRGSGTPTPTVSLLATPGTGQELNLEIKRKGLGFNLEKHLSNTLQFEISFRNEDKEGARFFGKGFACSTNWRDVGACSNTTGGAILMLPEPVDSTIRQLDVKLNFSGEKLRLSGGYYGSFYTNRFGAITPNLVFAGNQFGNQNGGLQAADALLMATMAQPVALWPDNQAHQFHLAGNYALTSHTLIKFKYAYTHATQNESFATMGLTGAPAGRADFGGVIDTTKAQIGFSAHPLRALHLHGDLAYNKKENKSPIDFYNTFYTCTGVYNAATRSCSVAWTTGTYTTGNASPSKWDAKLEASYRLPENVLLVGGVQYEREDFGTWTPTDVAGGVSGLKQKLAETAYRIEVRRPMSETLTGSVSYVSAHREGKSPWLQPANFAATGGTGVTPVSDAAIYNRTGIFPFIYMDRDREKIRLMGNWTPTERLSLQLFVDDGRDSYSGPTQHGLRSFKMDNISLDAGYTVSDKWRLTSYLSQGRQTVNAGHSTGYDAILKDTATSFGVGIAGTPTGQLRVGGDLVWIDDKLKYQQTADPGASAANATFLATSGGLPDVSYRLLRLSLFGEYAVEKNGYVRLDLIHNRTFFDEWTYTLNGIPYLFSDNTTLGAKKEQRVTFLGASYVYRFK